MGLGFMALGLRSEVAAGSAVHHLCSQAAFCAARTAARPASAQRPLWRRRPSAHGARSLVLPVRRRMSVLGKGGDVHPQTRSCGLRDSGICVLLWAHGLDRSRAALCPDHAPAARGWVSCFEVSSRRSATTTGRRLGQHSRRRRRLRFRGSCGAAAAAMRVCPSWSAAPAQRRTRRC